MFLQLFYLVIDLKENAKKKQKKLIHHTEERKRE